ncbi:MAG: AraC-like DNA-binding protein [Paraglaciecola sp.]|jgi:AraC-like DNA-binding protein
MPLSTLVNLLEPLLSGPLGDQNGPLPAAIDNVSLFRCNQAQGRTLLMYEPSLIFIAQGQKTGYLAEKTFLYNPGHYLVQTLPLPFECETLASSSVPLLGVSVSIDPLVLAELVSAMPVSLQPDPTPMASVPMRPAMEEAVTRLIRALHSPADAAVMGKARVREVIYEALKDQQGPALRALVSNQGNYSRIIQVLSNLHQGYDDTIRVEDMAREASMSVSAFHKHFKAVTQLAPLQYLKKLRLIKARLLLTHDNINVGQTASRVGYRSIHQFSRDYKTYFGISPNQDRRLAITAMA